MFWRKKVSKPTYSVVLFIEGREAPITVAAEWDPEKFFTEHRNDIEPLTEAAVIYEAMLALRIQQPIQFLLTFEKQGENGATGTILANNVVSIYTDFPLAMMEGRLNAIDRKYAPEAESE